MVRFHVAPGSVVNLHENEKQYLNNSSSSTSSSNDSSPTQTVAKLNDLSINEKYLSQRPTTQQTANLHILNRAVSEPGVVPSQTMQTSLSDPTLLSNDSSRPLIDGRPQLVYQTRAKSLPRPVHFTFSQEDIQASLYADQEDDDELSDEDDDDVYDEDATDSEVDDDEEEQFVDARQSPNSPVSYKQRSRPRPIPVHFSWSRHDVMKSQSQPQTVQNVGHWKTFPKSSVMLFSAEQMKAVVNLKMYENKKMREADRRAEARKDEYEDERENQRNSIQQQRQELIKKQKQLEQDFHRKHNEQALKLQQQKAAQQRQLQRSGSSSSIRTSSPAVNRAPSPYDSYNQQQQQSSSIHRLRTRQSLNDNNNNHRSGQLLSHGQAYKNYVNNSSYHSPSSRSSNYSDEYNNNSYHHQQQQQNYQSNSHVDHWMNSIRKDVHSKVNKALPGYPVSKQQTYFPQLGGSSGSSIPAHSRTSSINRVPQKPLPVQQQQQHPTSLFTRR